MRTSASTKYIPTEIVIRSGNDAYPDIYEDDEKKAFISEFSTDQAQQVKGDIPSLPVTFYFVGIRPSKTHQKCAKVNGANAIEITFTSLNLNSTVRAFKQCICQQFGLPKSRSLLVFYGNVNLSEQETPLKEYGVTDHSLFVLAIYDNIHTQHYDNGKVRDPISHKRVSHDQLSRLERERERHQRDMLAAQKRYYGTTMIPSSALVKNKSKKEINLDDALDQIRYINEHKCMQRVNALDIITQESGVDCVKMPICGHPMNEQSLHQFVLHQFKNKERVIQCPHDQCQQVFAYPVIKNILLSMPTSKQQKVHRAKEKKVVEERNDSILTMLLDIKQLISSQGHVDFKLINKEEKSFVDENDFNFAELELLSACNVLTHPLAPYELQKCADCQTILYRNQNDANFSNETQCPFCVSSVFCWCCSEKISIGDGHLCDTTFRAQTMEIVSTCAIKTVGYVKDVPSIRVCPKCNQLIHHVQACKHMKCSHCKTDFCFVCLKMKNDKGQWQCGGSSDRCPVAKRQNFEMLPRLNQKSIEIY